jgi:hypothetical protein
MWPQSVRFNEGVKNNQTIKTLCEVYDGIANTLLGTIPITDGNVSADNNLIRRRGNITLTDDTGELTPATANDLLNPLSGHELHLWRGIAFDGTGLTDDYELDPIIRMGISDIDIDDSGEGLSIRINGYDRARRCSRAKMTEDYHIAAGTNAGTAIEQLILSRVPGIQTLFSPTNYLTPNITLNVGDDPWEKAQKMAAAIGMELYFDPMGVLILRQIPDPLNAEIVWTYAEGDEAMILYTNKRYTDDDAYNHWIIIGESSAGAPVRGEAVDDNPTSGTYYLGPYGDVPDVIRTTLVTTETQAQIMANGRKNGELGRADRVHFNTIVNPGHEIGDVIQITRGKSKIDARYVMQQFSIPMVPSRAMDAMTRARTVQSA